MLLLISVILTLGVSWAYAEVKPCDFPEIKHGRLHNAEREKPNFPVAVGKSYFYFCDDNFVASSDQPRGRTTCTPEGWSPAPQCRRKCTFSYVIHGYSPRSEKDYFEGDSVRVDCHPNYSLPSKQNSMTCTENYGWYPAPICTRDRKCIFRDVIHGYSPRSEKAYLPGESVRVVCHPNYSLPNKQTTVTCTENGWSPPPTCIPVKTCSKSDLEIPNGFIFEPEPTYPLFKQVQYKCKPGYMTADGQSTGSTTCLQDGWSTQPTCIIRKCTFRYVIHGYSPSSEKAYFPGDSVRVHCHPGYSLPTQQTSMTCTENGWSPPPTCIPVKTCSKSDLEIPNGFISEPEPTYRLYKQVQYKCKPGHLTADGKSTGLIICQQYGWSAQPMCNKYCGMPLFSNATAVITGALLGVNDTLDYKCLDGYETRDGNSTGSMVCGEEGWTHLPTCYKSTEKCSHPPSISNGDLTSFPLTVYPPGSRIEYQCQAYYKLQGSKYVTCNEGQWSEPPRCIDPCVISEQNMNKNNIQHKGKGNKTFYAKTGDLIEFVCKSGHTAVTAEQSFQVVCRDGALEYPRCE